MCQSYPNVTSLSLSVNSLYLFVGGDKETINAIAKNGDNILGYPITWSSDRTDIATVDNNGQVTAISYGTVIITATCKGKKLRVKYL